MNESLNGRVTNKHTKNLRFDKRNAWFGPCVHVRLLMSGRDIFKAFLHDRNLREIVTCACGSKSENWKLVLVECSMHKDLTALIVCGVHDDESVNVERVLCCNARKRMRFFVNLH